MKKFVFMALIFQVIFLLTAFVCIIVVENNLDTMAIYRNIVGFGSSWYNGHLFKLNALFSLIAIISFVISIAKVSNKLKGNRLLAENQELVLVLVLHWFLNLVKT